VLSYSIGFSCVPCVGKQGDADCENRWKTQEFVALNVKFRQARFSQLTIRVKTSVFWDIMPCIPFKVNRRFGGTSKLNTALLLLRSCLLLWKRVYIAVAQKWPWYIRPSRGRCIATVLYATIYTYIHIYIYIGVKLGL
jgi:hypothetical protein